MDSKKLLISMLRNRLNSNEKIKDFSDKLRPLIDLKDENSIELMIEDKALFVSIVSWYKWHGNFEKLNNIIIMRKKQ